MKIFSWQPPYRLLTIRIELYHRGARNAIRGKLLNENKVDYVVIGGNKKLTCPETIKK